MFVKINARREGYGVDQCRNTMTVKELIEYLEQFNDKSPVYLSHDNGYTYGSITAFDIKEVDEENEE